MPKANPMPHGFRKWLQYKPNYVVKIMTIMAMKMACYFFCWKNYYLKNFIQSHTYHFSIIPCVFLNAWFVLLFFVPFLYPNLFLVKVLKFKLSQNTFPSTFTPSSHCLKTGVITWRRKCWQCSPFHFAVHPNLSLIFHTFWYKNSLFGVCFICWPSVKSVIKMVKQAGFWLWLWSKQINDTSRSSAAFGLVKVSLPPDTRDNDY